MPLNSSSFTRKNIENIIYDGKNISAFPTQTEPYLIIKMGPPGAGKSSVGSNAQIRTFGINPNEAIHIDIDKINMSFKTYQNQTRKLRENYNSKAPNSAFFSTISGIHVAHVGLTNMNKKPIQHSTSSIITQGIKGHKLGEGKPSPMDPSLQRNFCAQSFQNSKTIVICEKTFTKSFHSLTKPPICPSLP